jgi:hypothetical protein
MKTSRPFKALVAVFGVAMISFFSAIKSASASVVPDGFVGSYELKKAKYGICEPTLDVYESDSSGGYTSLTMGSYFFDRVDGGAWVDEDTVEKTISETTVINSKKIVHTADFHEKANGEVYYMANIAVLNGKLLDITFLYSGGIFDVKQECLYRRVSE